jgi:phosphate acyltransferase
LKIAVDAMGGDNAPDAIIQGVVLAAEEEKDDVRYVLVGQQEVISSQLKKIPEKITQRISIVNASEVVGMDESPVASIRKKKDSSISRMMDLAKSKEVDAVVSAGNTGAMTVASTLKLRTLPGIDRPAIAAIMPRIDGFWILIDAGANAVCKPKNLFQFGVMGEVFAREVMGMESPKIGLMSIGEEESKGNDLTKETLKLFGEADLNFVGNVEGHDTFTDRVDVVVCDGFVGNVLLKTSESVSHLIQVLLKDQVKKSLWAPFAGPVLKSIFKKAKKRIDDEEYGGAPLIGLDGVCIIAHGKASAYAIKNALRVAKKTVECQINGEIASKIKKYDRE